jgi:tRNA dimethylallyltransferase
VLRALEILRGTGKAPSQFAPIPPKYLFNKLALIPLTNLLEARIAIRSKWMLETGLLEEAQNLLPIFARDGRRATSFQAIGYKQALDHVLGVTDEAGKTVQISLEETERRINLATRQYAKRQGTWFKAEPNVTVFTDLETIKAALETILRVYS